MTSQASKAKTFLKLHDENAQRSLHKTNLALVKATIWLSSRPRESIVIRTLESPCLTSGQLFCNVLTLLNWNLDCGCDSIAFVFLSSTKSPRQPEQAK